jgi:hypothetical protein
VSDFVSHCCLLLGCTPHFSLRPSPTKHHHQRHQPYSSTSSLHHLFTYSHLMVAYPDSASFYFDEVISFLLLSATLLSSLVQSWGWFHIHRPICSPRSLTIFGQQVRLSYFAPQIGSRTLCRQTYLDNIENSPSMYRPAST